MTTERQREANRRNASRSTGPRSAAGKARSAQNARKHGLTTSITSDPDTSAEIARLAVALAGGNADLDPLQDADARVAAEADLELHRIRAYKAKLSSGLSDMPGLSHLDRRAGLESAIRAALGSSSIEQYERKAFSRRNRALRKIGIPSTDG